MRFLGRHHNLDFKQVVFFTSILIFTARSVPNSWHYIFEKTVEIDFGLNLKHSFGCNGHGKIPGVFVENCPVSGNRTPQIRPKQHVFGIDAVRLLPSKVV